MKKSCKLLLGKIASFAKKCAIRFFTTIWKTRLITKVIYVALAVAVGFLAGYRSDEKNLPVKISMTNLRYPDGEPYSVYKEGSKYYIDGDNNTFEITKEEYVRCVNKKIYDDEDSIYREPATNFYEGADITYKDSSGEHTEHVSDNPFRADVLNLYYYKKYVNDIEDENVDINTYETKETKEKVKNYYRMTTAWDDLCYKYRVKESKMMILERDKTKIFNNEEDSYEEVYTDIYKLGHSAQFIGPNSDMKGEEKEKYLDYGLIKMNPKLIKIKGKPIVYSNNLLGDKDVYGNKNNSYMGEVLQYLNERDVTGKRYFKMTRSIGDQMLHIYLDNKNGIGVAVLFRTDDYASRGLMIKDMDDILKNKNIECVSGVSFIAANVLAFMVLELIVFAVIGKLRKRKKKKVTKFVGSLNCCNTATDK